ncbi:MAG: class I SAM-dependent RNA methyltransferase [Chloroflexota bacterium]
MEKITLIAIETFGMEAVVKREVRALGFKQIKVSPGKVEFEAEVEDIPRANLWLRAADRVLLKIGEFSAVTFDELFEQTKDLPWEDWITKDGQFTVTGSAVKSTLGSVRACQSIVKKAVVERLSKHYQTEWFEETGPEFTIKVSMRNDIATLTIDTSGSGLNRRGYRKQSGQAALKETLAAGLVLLSFWNKDRLLVDPMCGSGTILIEAALIARNIAPGLKREFASEQWPSIPGYAWHAAKRDAHTAVLKDQPLKIIGYDIDPEMITASKANARAAGLGEDITFEQKDVKDLWIDSQYGVVISNPPYGFKLGEIQEINQMYISIHKTFKKKTGWSLYILTGDKKFPDYFKRAKPDRVRKLFNGPLEVNYYQYLGERPPRIKS